MTFVLRCFARISQFNKTSVGGVEKKISVNFSLLNRFYLQQNLCNMPPKRKRDTPTKNSSTTKTTKATKSKEEKIEEVPENEEMDTKSKRKRTATKKSYYKEEDSDSEVEVKPVKRAAKKPKKDDSEDEVEETPKTTKSRKKAAETPKPAPVKNKTSTTYDDIDFTCSKKSVSDEDWNFKISSWNVDGLRAWIKKGGLEYIEFEKPDILCLQETKCSLDKLPAEAKELKDYKVFWHCSDKEGYAGVGLYSKMEPLSVKYGLDHEDHDDEGRMITAEYEKFYVISVYVPNAGRGLVTLPKRMKWNEIFREYIGELDKKKPVIVCGDMNVAHSEIDLANPKTNTKNAGFTKEEREGLTEFLGDGYVDSFRKLYPDKTQAYTFWTYMANCRAKNVGWRLDYFLLSERLMDSVCDNIIRSEVFGSDHCPIALYISV